MKTLRVIHSFLELKVLQSANQLLLFEILNSLLFRGEKSTEFTETHIEMENKYESEDFKNLELIFPSWNKETLYSVFESNSFSLDHTVQSVLEIEGSGNSSSSSSSQSPSSSSAQLRLYTKYILFLQSRLF